MTEVGEINYNSPEYKRSRAAYMAQCTFEYFVSLLVADAFLAKVLTALGMSDFLVGIISSFISLSFVFQLLSFVSVCITQTITINIIPLPSYRSWHFPEYSYLPFPHRLQAFW